MVSKHSLTLTYLWCLSLCVCSQFHHNAYLQVWGRKRWTLAPTSEALRLRPFPEAHPRDRQAQAALTPMTAMAGDGLESDRESSEAELSEAEPDESPAEHAPSADRLPRAVPFAEVVLRPGDLLYVPPLTFHRVQTLGMQPALSLIHI